MLGPLLDASLVALLEGPSCGWLLEVTDVEASCAEVTDVEVPCVEVSFFEATCVEASDFGTDVERTDVDAGDVEAHDVARRSAGTATARPKAAARTRTLQPYIIL